LAKKQKKVEPERIPTKHQLSKWQRQMRIRRIVIIAAAVFLAGIAGWVGYEYHKDYENNPLHEVVIEVNGVPFTMGYFINTIDAYAYLYGLNSTDISLYGNYLADTVADDIINGELLRQRAGSLNISVTTDEINAVLQQYSLPNNNVYQDIVRVSLLQQKVESYFGSQLPAMMEQADVQVVLVESQEVATELITEVKAGGNFTALADEFSCNSSIEGDLGWLPEELMPNTLIANAAFNLTAGEISQPIYDDTAIKDVGYWLIEVTGKQGNEINARAMLLGSEAQAEQVKAQLAAGGNFSALAEEYSQYVSNTTDGELGLIKPGAMSSTTFDIVAFNLPLNQVSYPVKDTSVHTTGGYWLVNVVDRGDRQLSDSVTQQLIDNRYNAWLENWTNESTINTYLDANKKSYAINQVLAGM
jgi:peptidyl-prolyl cis-trans isomerase C